MTSNAVLVLYTSHIDIDLGLTLGAETPVVSEALKAISAKACTASHLLSHLN